MIDYLFGANLTVLSCIKSRMYLDTSMEPNWTSVYGTHLVWCHHINVFSTKISVQDMIYVKIV